MIMGAKDESGGNAKDGATVTCKSTVPIWEWPFAVKIAMEVATELNRRFNGQISVLFREIETPEPPKGESRWAHFAADIAWRNEASISIYGPRGNKSVVEVLDQRRNSFCGGPCRTTDEVLKIVIALMKERGMEMQRQAKERLTTAELLLTKLN